MTPPADHGRTPDVTIELFDLEQPELPGGDEEIIVLNAPVEAGEEVDLTTPNLHMGSTDERPLIERDEVHRTRIEEAETPEIQHLTVEVTPQMVEAASESGGIVVVPLKLGDFLTDPTHQQVTLHGVGEGAVPFGVRNSDGSVTLKSEDLSRIAIKVDEDSADGYSISITVEPDPSGTSPDSDEALNTAAGDTVDSEVLDELPSSRFDGEQSEVSERPPAPETDSRPDGLSVRERIRQRQREEAEQQDAQTTEDVPRDTTASDPLLAVTNTQGLEDTAIALDVRAKLTDLDGSETLSIIISGVPSGAVLSAGTDNGDGSWILSPDQLQDLTVTPPQDSHDDFDLKIEATSTESEGGATSSKLANLHVRYFMSGNIQRD